MAESDRTADKPSELLPEEIAEIKRLSAEAYAFIKATMSLKMQFEAAVRIVQSLPKEGPYQPSVNTKLQFYSLFKQATLGPCKNLRPPFYQVEELMKWRAWKQLKDMNAEQAMQTYCNEMKKIFDTLPFTKESEDFFFQSGLFLEYEKMPNATISEQYREKYDKRCAEYRGKVKSLLEDISSEFMRQQNANANSSGEESSGDSFVVYEKTDDNLEGELVEAKTKENVNETESEEEYSDPSETLDIESQVLDEPNLEARSNSPTSSAFFSVDDAHELQLLGKEYAAKRAEKLSLRPGGRSLNEMEKTQRKKNQGLSADAATQLLVVLQKIHVDLKEMIVKLDGLEDKSLLRHHSRCCCQREQSRSGSSDIAEKRWWPFPELSPRTTFLLLIWPLILHGGLRFLLFLRFARKNKLFSFHKQ